MSQQRAVPPQPPGQRWRARDIAGATAVVLAVTLGCVGAWFASAIFLFVFLGILFGLALTAGVDLLARFRVPRALAALVWVAIVFGALGGIGRWIAPTLGAQFSDIRSRLPEAKSKVSSWIPAEYRGILQSHPDSSSPATPPGSTPAPNPGAKPGTSLGPNAGANSSNGPSGLPSGFSSLAGRVVNFIGSTVELVIYLLLMAFIAIYMAVDPDLYYIGMLHLFPHRSRPRAEHVLSAMAAVMRRWLLTQCVAMVTIGVAWGIALTILRVKAALALAVIAGVLEFVPTIGPTIAAVPALALGILDSPQKGLEVLAVYLIIQGIEANILIPVLMKGQIDLPPALTIVWQALMALAFGFLGLLVAVPLLAAVLVAVKMLYVQDVIGDPVDLGRAAEATSG
jgi:predicted PurR-regulated permease PerM